MNSRKSDDDYNIGQRYPVYRGMSPTSEHRMEKKMNELEEVVEIERDARLRMEKEYSDLSIKFESTLDQLQELEDLQSGQNELIRRTEHDNKKQKNEIMKINTEYEMTILNLKKKNQETLTEVTEQLENINRKSNRIDKENEQYKVQLDAISIQLNEIQKKKIQSDTKIENLEENIRRIRQENDNLKKERLYLVEQRNSLAIINEDYERKIKTIEIDLNEKNSSFLKNTDQLNELKEYASDIEKENNQLGSINNNMKLEIDTLGQRLDDEIMMTQTLRDKINRENNERAATRQNFDKHVLPGHLWHDSAAIKIETELNLMNDQCEELRKTNTKLNYELQSVAQENENKIRHEILKYKKTLEIERNEFAKQQQNISYANSELNKANKLLATRVKELEMLISGEQKNNMEMKDSLISCERKQTILLNEMDELKSHLESSERTKKALQLDLHEEESQLSELKNSYSLLIREKRKMENELATTMASLEDLQKIKQHVEESVDRILGEHSKLQEEFKIEQEALRISEQEKRKLGEDVGKLSRQLEKAEINSNSDSKKTTQKLKTQIKQYENDCDTYQKIIKEHKNIIKKIEKQLSVQKNSTEEYEKCNKDLCEKLDDGKSKIKTIKRQLDETEEVLSITMAKYKKCQNILNEYDQKSSDFMHRVTYMSVPGSTNKIGNYVAKRIETPRRTRACSVNREVTRIVRI
ncbi:hypothetical protein A3Q56_01452 [Intoshia linei]|uniref:Myosin tail domain-containing protein n=1 Tax=Intoshia linei TaxID=1819745 RepID=A0A177B989_9BILA|nr:hypothetical protein A3Q56_01452 [Intoshia linei]